MVSRTKTASFEEFKDFTFAVARGMKTAPGEPKIWCEPAGGEKRARAVRFSSLEAGAKLLSAKNRMLLRIIVEREPQSVADLAAMAGRAEQNVLRTLNKMEAAGLVRFNRGVGRARRPVLAARKVFFEIDLVAA